MPSIRRFPSLAFAIAFLVVVAACDDSGNGPGEPALTAAQADSVAEVLTMDLDAEVDASTGSGTSVEFLLGAPAELSGSWCMPTVSPTPVVNTDGDRTPDSVRITFGPCANTWGNLVDSVSGTIDIVDPAPAVAGKNVRFVFDELRHKRVYASGLFTSFTMDGTRAASRDSSVLQHSVTDFLTSFVFRNGSSASHLRTWHSTFTADVEGSIQRDARLPSGNWNVTGTSEWTRGDRTHELSVTTDPQLHYNSTCTQVPRFDAGTLVAVVTRDGAESTVTIEFTACGQYTVTKT